MFKFTLLGLEISRDTCPSVKTEKMVKKKSKKMTPQQRKFKTAQAKCHKITTSPKDFGKCMSKKLTKKKGV